MEDRCLFSLQKVLCSPAGTERRLCDHNWQPFQPFTHGMSPADVWTFSVDLVVPANQVVKLSSPDGLGVVTLILVFHSGVCIHPSSSFLSGSLAPFSFFNLRPESYGSHTPEGLLWGWSRLRLCQGLTGNMNRSGSYLSKREMME